MKVAPAQSEPNIKKPGFFQKPGFSQARFLVGPPLLTISLVLLASALQSAHRCQTELASVAASPFMLLICLLSNSQIISIYLIALFVSRWIDSNIAN